MDTTIVDGERGSSAPHRFQRLRGPLVVAAVVGAASVTFHFRDPHTSGAWGYCPTLLLTGLACPACGGLRAVNDLTKFDVVAAFRSNALFVASLPLVAVWWLSVVRDRWRGSNRPWQWPLRHPRFWQAFALIAAVFTIVRNTPAGAWLYPT